jgi:hypothetical protein
MKTFAIVTITACLGLATLPVSAPGESDESDTQPSAAKATHEAIENLRNEYDQRRTNSLRALTEWYISQLQALRKTDGGQDRRVESELAAALKDARESYWEQDQPELRQALLAGKWIWKSDDDGNGVMLTFRPDGVAEHIGMHTTWRITGPSEVTLSADGDGKYVLHFNSSLHAFEGDRRGVFGTSASLTVRN